MGWFRGPKTHLIKVIWPHYMLIWSIFVCFYGQKIPMGPYLSNIWPMVTKLQMGISPGVCWIFWSSWVQMKGLRVILLLCQSWISNSFWFQSYGAKRPWSTGLIIVLYIVWELKGEKNTSKMEKMTKVIITMKFGMV